MSIKNISKEIKKITKLSLVSALFLLFSTEAFAIKTSKQSYNGNTNLSALQKEFNSWKGVRYKWGGNSKAGIDCSGFVKTIYSKVLDKEVSRTTSSLKTEGRYIPKDQLQVGDLVFFRKNKHVGIYMGNGKFIHSSTKRGVEMNTLNEGYYAKVYTQSRRIH